MLAELASRLVDDVAARLGVDPNYASQYRLRLLAADRVMETVGLRTRLFAAPRWLASDGAMAALPDAGFRLVAGLTGIYDLERDTAVRARVLGIGNDAHAVELEVENTPLTDLRADMLHVKVGEHSQLVGVMLYELRLPVGANVTLVVNGERSYVPGERSVLRAGDQLLVVTKEAVRARTLARFREVSEGGRLAGWRMPTAPRT